MGEREDAAGGGEEAVGEGKSETSGRTGENEERDSRVIAVLMYFMFVCSQNCNSVGIDLYHDWPIVCVCCMYYMKTPLHGRSGPSLLSSPCWD